MRICSIGECMIELSNIEHNIFRQNFAGDTANSAIYLSRLGAKSSYISSTISCKCSISEFFGRLYGLNKSLPSPAL
mgnify:CR=1 FL=1